MLDHSLIKCLEAGERVFRQGKVPQQTACLLGPKQHLRLLPKPEPTIIWGQTSKFCPTCLAKGFRVKRHRLYVLNGPFHINDCDPTLPWLLPRVSWKKSWWNKGFVRKIVAPPFPPTEYPCFISRPKAVCPKCGCEVVVQEIEGIRQFGLLRLSYVIPILILLRLLELVKPIK